MKILLIKADRMIAEQKSPVILGFFGVMAYLFLQILTKIFN